ncbi:MAG: hypothetical protein ACOYL4_07710 [Miltoncostaeaceae bacterium]
MIRPIHRALLGIVVVTASPTLAFASTISLSVNPSTLQMRAGEARQVTVTNIGGAAANLRATVGDYGMTPGGTVILNPRTAPPASAARWVTVTPSTLALVPGQSAVLDVQSTAPSTARPGDHEALILLSGSPVRPGRGTVQVDVRLGIGMLINVPGDLRRDLVLTRVRERGHGATRTLQIGLTNRGNVNEVIGRGQAKVTFRQGRRVFTRVLPGRRTILPGARATVTIRCPGTLVRSTRAVLSIRPSAPSVLSTASLPPVLRRTVVIHP